MPRIQINAENYEYIGSIVEYQVPVQGDARRVGEFKRSDNIKISRYVFDSWADMGIGWARMRRLTGRGVGGMRMSTAETRFPDAVYLALLEETETHATPADFLKKFVHFKGDIWAIFEVDIDEGPSGANTVESRKYNASNDTWEGGGTVFTNAYSQSNSHQGAFAFDAVAHKGKIFVLGTDDRNSANADDIYDVYSSEDGASWADAGLTGWNDTAYFRGVTAGNQSPFLDGGRLLSSGNTLLAAFYENPDSSGGSISQVRIYYSTDLGANWTAGAVIPSGGGPMAFVEWVDPLTAGLPGSPVLITSDGVYRVDVGGTTFDRLVALDGDPNTGRWAVVGDDGPLYVPLGSGDIWRIEAFEGGTIQVNNIGPHSHADGLPSEFQGHANYLMSGKSTGSVASPWLFVLYGGHASGKTATLLAYDYETSRIRSARGERHPAVWHHVHNLVDNAISGMAQDVDLIMCALSSESDGTFRLHLAAEGGTASALFMLEDPMVSPGTGGSTSHKFTDGSYVEIADDDMGDPHHNSTVLAGLLEAGNLDTASANDDKAVWKYGADGAAWDATTVGTFYSDDLDLLLASGAGVAAKTLRNRLELARGSTNTTKVSIKEFEMQVRSRHSYLRGFQITIDLNASARNYTSGANAQSTIISRLETILKSDTLVTMKYGKSGALYVEAFENGPSQTTARGFSQAQDQGQRTGFKTIWLEEVLQA